VIPNGADPTVFRPDSTARENLRRQYGIPGHHVVIGFVGILRPWHGVELLLDAFARASRGRSIHLLIVGDGPSRAEFEARARSLGLERSVTVTGRVPHERIPSHAAAMDLGVSPRATFYASPMKVPEYMAAGVPVLAPRMPNLIDLVEEGRTGLLFEPEDVDSLADSLERAVDDEVLRARMGKAARTAIVQGRSWQHNASQVLDCLNARRSCA
jgi:glycosyltransferase involved in cell wall biosynthesis